MIDAFQGEGEKAFQSIWARKPVRGNLRMDIKTIRVPRAIHLVPRGPASERAFGLSAFSGDPRGTKCLTARDPYRLYVPSRVSLVGFLALLL